MIKGESGQAVIIVALLLVVVCAFAALGVDIGAEVAHGMHMQKAVDAAALAAASNPADPQPAAETVLSANQVPSTDNTDITTNDSRYTVAISELHHFIFAPVLGFKSITLTRSATADTAYYPLADYAIFNGSSTQALQLAGNGVVTVNGNVHSNCDVDFGSNGGVNIDGNVTLDGNIVQPCKGTITGSTTYNSFLPLPDYSKFLTNLKNEAISNNTYYSTDQTFGGNSSEVLSGPIYVDGSVTLENNGSIQQNTVIYASGGITVASNGSISATGSNGGISFALYSGGNITFDNNGSLTIDGLIYAPNGAVTSTNNGSVTINGSIVGQNVDLAGNGSPIVTYEPFDSGFQYYPQTQIAHLIQ